MSDPGVLLIEGIPAGAWTITQDEAPDGFEIANDIVDIEVEEGDTTDVVLVLETSTGIVRIVAVDANQQPLPGACWALFDNDTEIASQCDDNSNGGIADDGFATMVDIAPGTYSLRQTGTPDGYLTPDDREITVATGENEPFLVEHQAGSGHDHHHHCRR